MLGKLGPYFSYINLSFLSILSYRMRFYTGIVTYILFITVHYYIWEAVYSDNPTAAINGFKLNEMITYIAIGWIARSFYFSNVDEEIDDIVKTGQISTYLLRPVSFHLMMLSKAVGESLFRILFFTAPICLAVFYLYPISFPANFSAGIHFLLLTVGSFMILAEVNFLVGLLAFSLKSIQGISRAKYFLLQLFSGLLLPLSFFPKIFRDILDLLPFKYITYIPMQAYLGKLNEQELIKSYVAATLWSLLLVLLVQLFWKKSVKSLTLQGG